MATTTIGFTMADEDRVDLDEAGRILRRGGRSAYLHATPSAAKSIKLAEQLRELQGYGGRRSAEFGLTVGDAPEVTRRVLKGRA